LYARGNPGADSYTARPAKYPQKRFNPKPCRLCGKMFEPLAPSHLYCSDECTEQVHTDNYLRRTYGISLTDYKEMLEKQNHRCAICGGEGFLMNKERHKIKLVVDHCHVTGKVRGLLRHNCNRALGLFNDNTEALSTAIQYLEGATTIRKE
jgi:ribosomal protein S14/predicted nucleic acid-binding Zn ribbon protein